MCPNDGPFRAARPAERPCQLPSLLAREHGRLPTRGRAAPAEDALAQRLDRLVLQTEQSPLPDALALEFADVLDAERELPAEGFWDSGLCVAVCWCFVVFIRVAF